MLPEPHLLSLAPFKRQTLLALLDQAKQYIQPNGKIVQNNSLAGKTLVNLFFEPSTRTRTTFEMAAHNLGAKVININFQEASFTKGESLLDTVHNLQAMQCDIVVLRHPFAGAAQFIAQEIKDGIHIINAGDGCHAHPSQALLDMFTIYQHIQNFHECTVAIIGDIIHSRVARSQIHALQTLHTSQIRVIAPKTLLPSHIADMGVEVFQDLASGLKGVDVIMLLRLQKERMQKGLLPQGNAYYRQYGLKSEHLPLANPNAIILHPGPLNRDVEIESSLVEHPQAKILEQVTNGIAVRMAILQELSQ